MNQQSHCWVNPGLTKNGPLIQYRTKNHNIFHKRSSEWMCMQCANHQDPEISERERKTITSRSRHVYHYCISAELPSCNFNKFSRLLQTRTANHKYWLKPAGLLDAFGVSLAQLLRNCGRHLVVYRALVTLQRQQSNGQSVQFVHTIYASTSVSLSTWLDWMSNMYSYICSNECAGARTDVRILKFFAFVLIFN